MREIYDLRQHFHLQMKNILGNQIKGAHYVLMSCQDIVSQDILHLMELPHARHKVAATMCGWMLAVRCFERSGDLEKLRIHTIDRPVPSPGHAVVRVLAAAGNGLDFKVVDACGSELTSC